MKKIVTIIMVFVIMLSMFLTMVPLVKTQTDEWSEPQQLTTDPANDGIASIMQDAGGKIWLVWANMQDKTGNLWYKTSSNGGKSWSTPEILVPEIRIPRATFPGGTSLLQDSTGRIWVSWASGQLDYDIYYITSDDGGLSWSTPQQLTDYPYDDNWPTLVEVCGEVWIIFRSFGLSYNEDIWYRKTSDGGTTWSDPIQLTSHSAMEFTNDAMVDSSGKVWLVWQRGYGPGTYDLYYMTSTNHGESWSPEQPFADLPTNEGYPSVIEDASGKIFVSYAREYDIWYRTTVDGGNTWSDYLQLTADTYKDGVPYAALINGEIWVVWQSDRAGNWNIWTSKLSSPAEPVGGLWVPINKTELLAPWITLASLMTVAAVSVAYVKHRKKQQN